MIARLPEPAGVPDGRSNPRVTLVHDYLTQRGGAERVVLTMARAFPAAPLFTSLYHPAGTFPEFHRLEVSASRLNSIALLRSRHRMSMLFLAPTFARALVDADVALISSSGWAHGIRCTGRKVVYCHSPARWLYQTERYLGRERRSARLAFAPVKRSLLKWDRTAALSCSRYLTPSTIVRRRIQAAYGIDAEVVPAPHSIDLAAERTPVAGIRPGYHLCVSRLLPYKNIGAVVDAFRALPDLRLVVVGTGPLGQRLRASSPPNVTFTGTVSDPELRWLYANSSALLAASHEDYGLTPIEAAAFGKPALVLRDGGFLDTVAEGTSGLFFDRAEAAAISDAVTRSAAMEWDPKRISDHAGRFSEDSFMRRMREIVLEEAELR